MFCYKEYRNQANTQKLPLLAGCESLSVEDWVDDLISDCLFFLGFSMCMLRAWSDGLSMKFRAFGAALTFGSHGRKQPTTSMAAELIWKEDNLTVLRAVNYSQTISTQNITLNVN